MERLVEDFRKAEDQVSTSASPGEIITTLSTINTKSFKLVQTPLGSGDPEKGLYSVQILITTPEEDRKFVSCGIGKTAITEKAAKQAFEFLVQEAEDRLGPRKVRLTSKIDDQTNVEQSSSNSNEISINEEEAQIDFDSVLIRDEKLMHMFNDLMVKGYRIFKKCFITSDPNNPGNTVYKAAIRIPEIGEFEVQSRGEMKNAIRGAALKLKYHLKDNKIADYDQPLEPKPYSGNQFPSPFFTGVAPEKPRPVQMPPQIKVQNPKQIPRAQLSATSEQPTVFDPLEENKKVFEEDGDVHRLADSELVLQIGESQKAVQPVANEPPTPLLLVDIVDPIVTTGDTPLHHEVEQLNIKSKESMDQLIEDFHKVLEQVQSESASEIIAALSTINTTSIALTHKLIGTGNDDEKKLCTAQITVKTSQGERKFVAGGYGKSAATEKVAEQVCEFLMQEAENRMCPREVSLPLLNIDDQNNEQQPSTTTSNLNEASTCKEGEENSQNLFDSVLINDKRLMYMFADLQEKGYSLHKRCSTRSDPRNQLDILFTATIEIPGMGNFSVHARDDLKTAIRGAALKLKYYCKDKNIADYDRVRFEPEPYHGNSFPKPTFAGGDAPEEPHMS